MTYTIYLTAHEYGFVEIEANSEEEAREMAYEAEMDGDVHWCDREVEVTDLLLEETNEDEEEDEEEE